MIHPWGDSFAASRQGSLAFPMPVVSYIEASVFAMMVMNDSSIIVGCDIRSVLV